MSGHFRKKNFTLVSELLSNIDWEVKLKLLDVCKAYRSLLDEYESIRNQAVPLLKPIERIKPKWLNAEDKRGIKLKHELWCKMKSKGKCQTLNKTEFLIDYKRTCKILKKNIKKSIVKIEIELAVSSKKNPKILYYFLYFFLEFCMSVYNQLAILFYSVSDIYLLISFYTITHV